MKIRRSRISAFLIDMLFIIILTSITANIYAVNPYLYDSEEVYNNYIEIYNDTISELDVNNVEVPKKLQKAMYKYEKTNSYLYVWYIGFGIIYFVVFQWLNKGQTLGKKMFKIKVVNNDEENPNLLQYFVRYLINGSTLLMGVNIVLVIKTIILFMGVGATTYYQTHMLLQVISILIEILLFATLIVHKNNRLINDILARTKVVEE